MNYFEFTKRFPDENSAIDFIVATKYKDGYVCPKCGCMHKGIYHQKYNHRFMYCNNCKSEFSALKVRYSRIPTLTSVCGYMR